MSRRPRQEGTTEHSGGAQLHVVPARDHDDMTKLPDDESVTALRRLTAKALGSGEADILRGMLSTLSSDLACFAELTFDRDSHVSAALSRLHERIEAVLQLADLCAGKVAK